jgi:hypothetical protein
MVSEPNPKILRVRLVGIDRPIEAAFRRDVERIPDGRYSPDELVSILKDGWVSYWECHKCGWFDTCPFPERFPNGKARDIQCKITLIAMGNFLRAWWPRLLKMSHKQRVEFFRAFFYFTQYFMDVYIGAGTLVNNLDVDWWGQKAAMSLTMSPLSTRLVLNQYAEAVAKLPIRRVLPERFVFVEGESEEAFLHRLRDLRFLSSHLEFESLQGKGNAKPSRFPLRLLKRRGYHICVQLDGDSRRQDRYRELREAVKNVGGSVFVFSRDFESSFPAPFLHFALQQLGIKVELPWLERRLRRAESGSVVRDIEALLQISVPKVELAKTLADLADHEWSTLMRRYRRAEITRWLFEVRFGATARPRTA